MSAQRTSPHAGMIATEKCSEYTQPQPYIKKVKIKIDKKPYLSAPKGKPDYACLTKERGRA